MAPCCLGTNFSFFLHQAKIRCLKYARICMFCISLWSIVCKTGICVGFTRNRGHMGVKSTTTIWTQAYPSLATTNFWPLQTAAHVISAESLFAGLVNMIRNRLRVVVWALCSPQQSAPRISPYSNFRTSHKNTHCLQHHIHNYLTHTPTSLSKPQLQPSFSTFSHSPALQYSAHTLLICPTSHHAYPLYWFSSFLFTRWHQLLPTKVPQWFSPHNFSLFSILTRSSTIILRPHTPHIPNIASRISNILKLTNISQK
jgi:hypothetical protein